MSGGTDGSAPAAPGMYRYQDSNGTTVVVDAWEKVPPGLRARAQKVDVDRLPEIPVLTTTQGTVEKVLPSPRDFHLPSFGFGFLACLVLVLVTKVARAGLRRAFKLAFALLLLALLSGLYLGTLRKSAGLSESQLANPEQVIEDARRAQKALQQRLDEDQKTLKKIEEQSR